jgi:hypothetical protein
LTYLICTRERAILVLPLAFAGGLTVLSHPNAAWFAAYSSALVVVFYCRSRHALAYSILSGVGAAAVAAPWLVLSISRHGVATCLAASQSSNPGPPAWELLLKLQVTQEPFAPILALFALIGALVSARNKKWWLPSWLALACLLDTRYSGTFAMVPLALLVGVAADALAPLFSAKSRFLQSTRSRLEAFALIACIALIPLAGTLEPNNAQRALPDSDRSAMRWIAASTPSTATFLVVAPAGVSAGSETEWFPALAERRSLGTYQGLEWLEHEAGPSAWQRYDRLQTCGARDVACLDGWAREGDIKFDYVFVREFGTAELRRSLSTSTDFALVYEAPDVSIFARNVRRGD